MLSSDHYSIYVYPVLPDVEVSCFHTLLAFFGCCQISVNWEEQTLVQQSKVSRKYAFTRMA